MNEPSHAIFGAGPVGLAVARSLADRGSRVRIANRSGRAHVPDGVEVVAVDASDPAAARRVATGADVVYFCLNPPYTDWAELFPPLQASVVDAAAAADARLVAMENVYMYGAPAGRPITEDTPYEPVSNKGEVRAEMTRDLFAAHKAGKVQATSGRASDFFGPHVRLSALGERVFEPALAGKTIRVLGDPAQPHTYTYIDDIGEALVILGERDAALGKPWHIPSPETTTTIEVVKSIGDSVGGDLRVQGAPRAMLRLIGLFNRLVRENIEMLYEFEEPFVVDTTRFTEAFGQEPTPLAEALSATLAWYRNQSD